MNILGHPSAWVQNGLDVLRFRDCGLWMPGRNPPLSYLLGLLWLLAVPAVSAEHVFEHHVIAHAPVEWCYQAALDLPDNFQQWSKVIQSISVTKQDDFSDDLVLQKPIGGTPKKAKIHREFHDTVPAIDVESSSSMYSVHASQLFAPAGTPQSTKITLSVRVGGLAAFLPRSMIEKFLKEMMLDAGERFAFFAGRTYRQEHARRIEREFTTT